MYIIADDVVNIQVETQKNPQTTANEYLQSISNNPIATIITTPNDSSPITYAESEPDDVEDLDDTSESEKYLDYDDFSFSNREKFDRKQPMQRNHRKYKYEGAPMKLKSKVTPQLPNQQSTRKNLNANSNNIRLTSTHSPRNSKQSLKEYEEKLKKRWGLEIWDEKKKKFKLHFSKKAFTYRICEHSPLTASVCRLCEYAEFELALPTIANNLAGRKTKIETPCDCKGDCQLSGPKCCKCMDRRPHSLTYFAYQDGRGCSKIVKRNHFYCPSCNGSKKFGLGLDLKSEEVNFGEDVTCHAVSVSTIDSYEFSDSSNLNLCENLQSASQVTPEPLYFFQKTCGHDCSLKLQLKCCQCSDERPIEETYWVYLVDEEREILDLDEVCDFEVVTDGILVETSRRDELYCEKCKF
ncbi:hypothetical protein HK098_001626 [Nowakowskiella sp. JEL0407]|nr:hypothetical protein HK098_001620 [Nowakowskiella sp. JEL0407]KAJ3123834.1 hypothetical protein HK098_001626 [Nowakowskiella sp. JEL0407]